MQTRIAGFSLVELMVVVGIIGVLAAIAIPRYHSFLVQARRAEATSNLNHIATLQETYRAEHGNYYYGMAMSGNNGIGYKDGQGKRGSCEDPTDARDEGLSNKLGFRPKNYANLRYFYQMHSTSVVVASAASDTGGRYVYPDCDGGGPVECRYGQGDALRLALLSSGKPEVCRNINKYCPDGAASTEISTPVPPPPPPPSCTCTTTTTCGSVPPADTICVGQFAEKSCQEKTVCLGHSSCASTSYADPSTEQVAGTKDCNRPCDCPLEPPSGWPELSTDPAAQCTGSFQTQSTTETIACPDSSTETQSCPYSRSVAGTKSCCNPLTHCCNGDDIDPNQTMMNGIGQEYCCPTSKLDESYSCTGAGRTWSSCGCQCRGGFASSCTMDGNRKFIDMSVGSDGNVANNACTCACDDTKVSAAICEARDDDKTKYDPATCSCIKVTFPEDECQNGNSVQNEERLCLEKPGEWQFSPGAKDSNNQHACECKALCPNGVTTVEQATSYCDAGIGMDYSCSGAVDSKRFDRQSCTCAQPYCKRTQCVQEAVTDILGKNAGLTVRGNNIAVCYSDCESSDNKETCFEDAIVAATSGQGDAAKLRKLISSSNYTTTGDCAAEVKEALNAVKHYLPTLNERNLDCDGEGDGDKMAFEYID